MLRYTKMFNLPKQLGTSVLHVPREVHSVSAVPFRTKPSSQVDLHWEPKLNSSWGSEQIKEPWEGEIRVGHLLAAGEHREGTTKHVFTTSCVKWYQKGIIIICYDKDILIYIYICIFFFYPSNVLYQHSTCPESCTQCLQCHSAGQSPRHRLLRTENQNWTDHLGQNRIWSREEDLVECTS